MTEGIRNKEQIQLSINLSNSIKLRMKSSAAMILESDEDQANNTVNLEDNETTANHRLGIQ